eukprot:5957936-Pyramimonas_sp.AAC.1
MSLQLALMPPPAAAPVPKAKAKGKAKAKAKSKSKTATVEMANDATVAWWTKFKSPGSVVSGSEAADSPTATTLALAAPEVADLGDFEDAPEGDDVASSGAAASSEPLAVEDAACSPTPTQEVADKASPPVLKPTPTPGEVFVWQGPEVKHEPSNPTCYRCKQEVDVLRAPLIGKGQGSWKCE